MPELTRWELSQARLALRAAIIEGLKVVLKPGGGVAVRGGQPSETVRKLLKDHREGILWHLKDEAAKSASVIRRTEHVTCAVSLMASEVDLPEGLR